MKIKCKGCSRPIVSDEHVIILHQDCYEQIIEDTKESGVKIGMRIHGIKGKYKGNLELAEKFEAPNRITLDE